VSRKKRKQVREKREKRAHRMRGLGRGGVLKRKIRNAEKTNKGEK